MVGYGDVFLPAKFDVWMDWATVLGMVLENEWAAYFRLCSAQPHRDRVFALLLSGYAEKLPTTLWFWNLHIALAVKKNTGQADFESWTIIRETFEKRWMDDGGIFTVLFMLPHCWAMFVNIYLRKNCATIVTVLGMCESMGSMPALLLNRPQRDRVFAGLLSGYAADKLPTTLWFWYRTLAHIGCLGSLAICTKVNQRP